MSPEQSGDRPDPVRAVERRLARANNLWRAAAQVDQEAFHAARTASTLAGEGRRIGWLHAAKEAVRAAQAWKLWEDANAELRRALRDLQEP